MTIHRIRLLGDPILRARCEPITKPALDRGPGDPRRHAGDAARLAVALRQRARDRRAADRRAGADDLLRDGPALGADQPGDRGHRQRGLRGLGRLLLLPQPAGPGVTGLPGPGALPGHQGRVARGGPRGRPGRAAPARDRPPRRRARGGPAARARSVLPAGGVAPAARTRMAATDRRRIGTPATPRRSRACSSG